MDEYEARVGNSPLLTDTIAEDVADGLKLLIKELIYPSFANKIIFFLGPIIFSRVHLFCSAKMITSIGRNVWVIGRIISSLVKR